MHTCLTLCAAALVLLAAAASAPAWAQAPDDKPQTPPPFEEVKRLSYWPPADKRRSMAPPDKADSGCIGDPKTPLCAVETLLACFIWQRPDLCRLVRDHDDDDEKTPRQYLARRYKLDYFVNEVRRAREDDWTFGITVHRYDTSTLVRKLSYKDKIFNPDAVLISLEQRGCAIAAPHECAHFTYAVDAHFEGFTNSDYLLKFERGAWKIYWARSLTNVWPEFVTFSADSILIGAQDPDNTFEDSPDEPE